MILQGNNGVLYLKALLNTVLYLDSLIIYIDITSGLSQLWLVEQPTVHSNQL